MNNGTKRRQIMQSAEKLFIGKRLHEITMDDVARHAGVGKGTIYRYFRDKNDLFFQTASSGFEELCEILHTKVRPDDKFERQLVAACEQVVRFFDRRRQLFRMMQSEESRVFHRRGQMRQKWLDERTKLLSMLGSIISRGVSRQDVRSDIPAVVLAGMLLGMLRTASRDLADLTEGMTKYEWIVDLFLHGARGKSGSSAIESSASFPRRGLT